MLVGKSIASPVWKGDNFQKQREMEEYRRVDVDNAGKETPVLADRSLTSITAYERIRRPLVTSNTSANDCEADWKMDACES